MNRHPLSADMRPEVEWCSVKTFRGDECGNRPAPDAPFPVCVNHMISLSLYYSEYRSGISLRALEASPAREKQPAPDDRGVIYYVQFGDLIKIGTTTNLSQRLSALGPVLLLVTEPGSYELESLRHQQFAACRTSKRGEWFKPSPDLLSHIEMLKAHAASSAA